MSNDAESPSVIRFGVALVSCAILAGLLYPCYRGSKSQHTGWQHAGLTLGVVVLTASLLVSVVLAVRYSDLYARWTKPLPPDKPVNPTSAADELRPRFQDPAHVE